MPDAAALAEFLGWLDEEGYLGARSEEDTYSLVAEEYLQSLRPPVKPPVVGSKVIYYSDDLGAVEAIVTRVRPHLKVELVIVHYETPSVEAVHYSASPGRIDYTWHWPEESKDIWPDHHAAAIKEATS